MWRRAFRLFVGPRTAGIGAIRECAAAVLSELAEVGFAMREKRGGRVLPMPSAPRGKFRVARSRF